MTTGGASWYNKDSLANVLSLAAVRKIYNVTMNTGDEEAAMIVHKKNGEQMKSLGNEMEQRWRYDYTTTRRKMDRVFEEIVGNIEWQDEEYQ